MLFKHKRGLLRKKGGRKWLSKGLLVLSIGGLAGGIYLLILVLTPNVPVLFPVEPINVRALPKPVSNRVYIPKIGVNESFSTGDESALDKGVWHRYPERGDPVQGGNFILSAHRFQLGTTPGQTKRKSPFYHFGKVLVGDQIIVDFNGKRYGYEVTEKRSVKPNQIEIEAPSDEPKLTVYTCTLKGQNDGRDIVIAKPLGEVDADGNVLR